MHAWQHNKLWLALGLVAALVLGACSHQVIETGGVEGAQKAIEKEGTGLFIRTTKDSDDYEIIRSEPAGAPLSVKPDTWTIFVYMCGSDLESEKGAASRDLREMLDATPSDNVNIVIETGGAKAWADTRVDETKTQRFVKRRMWLDLVDELELQNMGSPDTLADFLRWGVANYPADHMALIMWDHGGGSGKGLCMDENFDFDTLDLRELDKALNAAFVLMDRKFEFIGLDACLMGTVECANVAATYAKYLIASEEWEPGTGWPHDMLVNYIVENPKATGAEIGRYVCDAFMPTGERAERLTSVTLATYDLSKMDALLTAFNNFSRKLYEATSDEETFTNTVRALNEVENFGGNNRTEGYSNMIDLGGLADACAPYAEGAQDLINAIKDVVCYHVSGPTHEKAYGMSIFYPLRVGRRHQLELFQYVCVNPSYLSVVDRIVRAANADPRDLASALVDYNNEGLYVNGEWIWVTQDTSDEDQTAHNEYWSDISELSNTEYGSDRITFDTEPSFSPTGQFAFVLDKNGRASALRAGSSYFEFIDDDILYLGRLLDVNVNWETGLGTTMIDGMWLSLPDGQSLAIEPVDQGDDHIVYSSPILLNDEKTNLRIARYDDGHCVVEGTWSGIDDHDVADRGIMSLRDGDVIKPLYLAIDRETKEQSYYAGEPVTVEGDLEVSLGLLDPDYYGYALFVEDLFGGMWVSEIEPFEMDFDHHILIGMTADDEEEDTADGSVEGGAENNVENGGEVDTGSDAAA